jgi:putative ABC transport system permease protein
VSAREALRIAFASLGAYKLRTFLTVLGNVVAVSSVIAVVSLLDGMDLYVRQEIAQEGSNVATLRNVDELKFLTNMEEFLDSLHNPDITMEDYRALREADLQTIERIAANRSGTGQVDHQGHSIQSVYVQGWTSDYPHFQELKLSSGRHFNPFEDAHSRPVAVIGSEVAQSLFRGKSPLGQQVRVNGTHVEVIGVLAEQSGGLGDNPNLIVIMPLGQFFKIFGSRGSLTVRLRANEISHLEAAKEEVERVMRVRHRLRPSEKDDFAVTSADRVVDLWKSISRAIFTALTFLVSISLVVGGVVIMNIMLVSVTERIREIGTRKALGAKRRDILSQFLIEAVALSMTGGVIGILFGFGAASAISFFSPLPYAIKPWSILAGLLVTFIVGLFFGIYPANRAARLDPVTALRHE